MTCGFEFSGRDSKGCRVMGMSSCGALASMIKTVPGLIWKIPDHWTMEEAATVPVVYSTVCLFLIPFKLFYKILFSLLFEDSNWYYHFVRAQK